MAVSIGLASRLQFAELRIIDGVTFWDIVDLPAFRARPNDTFHQVEGSDRVDTLAKTHYGDEGFWWVIAWANDLEILPTDLNVGDVITIPDPEFIRAKFFPEVGNGA